MKEDSFEVPSTSISQSTEEAIVEERNI